MFIIRSPLIFLKQVIALLVNNTVNDLLNKDVGTIDQAHLGDILWI